MPQGGAWVMSISISFGILLSFLSNKASSQIAKAAKGLLLYMNYFIIFFAKDFFLALCHGQPNIDNPSIITCSFSKQIQFVNNAFTFSLLQLLSLVHYLYYSSSNGISLFPWITILCLIFKVPKNSLNEIILSNFPLFVKSPA
eukprot:TRINITY_DN48369_c0_g1_i2.p1 TRINITY_DN48369_c0_g1~~TRINITY_DN48369_c0_g1_i2.p1  ORF type:complete len:143 (-),score=4.99 TRINITY_DN48369_c0_g1_i2:23-451(-)